MNTALSTSLLAYRVKKISCNYFTKCKLAETKQICLWESMNIYNNHLETDIFVLKSNIVEIVPRVWCNVCISGISGWEYLTLGWNYDDDICFILDHHTDMSLYSKHIILTKQTIRSYYRYRHLV